MPGYLRPHVQIVVPPPASPTDSSKKDHLGNPGSYWVEFTFQLHWRLLTDDYHGDLRAGFIGDSHLVISDPIATEDDKKHVFSVRGVRSGNRYLLFCNRNGRLSHINVHLDASNFADALSLARLDLEPLLAGWFANFNVPFCIFRTRILEESSNIVHNVVYFQAYPTRRMSQEEMGQDYWFPEDQRVLEFYRDGLSATSPKYQFLCFYKVIELILLLRTNRDREARRNGVSRSVIPETLSIEDWFRSHLTPDVTRAVEGKKYTYIRDEVLRPLRNKIAHALTEDDDGMRVTDDEVFPYLPVAKLMAERLLRDECKPRDASST